MRTYGLLILLFFYLWGGVAYGRAGFSNYIEELRSELIEKNFMDSELINDVLNNATYNKKVIAYSNKQSELLLSLPIYLKKNLTDGRIEMGVMKFHVHRDFFTEVAQRYEVSPYILVALWGMESSYGKYLGDVPLFDALLSLSFFHSSTEKYKALLMDAFKLVEKEGFNWKEMSGSFVGDLGQLQFSTQEYLKYAVDGNGNGLKDLWNELPDVIYSSANLLKKKGWQYQILWGEEVRIPSNINELNSGLDITLPLSRWHAQGLKRLDGTKLALRQKFIKASLLFIPGKKDQGFLLYDNFYTLLNWSNSVNYAIAVGLLANAIEKRSKEFASVVRAKKTNSMQTVTRNDVRLIQKKLAALGYNPGFIDGIIGPKTKKAVRKFQESNQLEVNGKITLKLLELIKGF